MPGITLIIIYNLRKINRSGRLNVSSIFPQVVFPRLIKHIQTESCHLRSNLRQATFLERNSSLYQGAERAKETQRDFRGAKESKLEARTVFNCRILSSREAN